MKQPLVIIFLGPPGSGKGTQAELLEKKFNLERIGSGDLLRSRKKKKDYTGKKIGQVIDQGKRVPTPVIFALWINKMESLKKNQLKAGSSGFDGFIIDGSPRTIPEAELIGLALEWYGWDKNVKVFFINISNKEVVFRLTKRRICGLCGRIIPYIKKFRKLKKCDRCQGDLIVRADDNIKGIKERLRWFKAEVMPVIDYYKKRKKLIKINGEQSIENVFKDILKSI